MTNNPLLALAASVVKQLEHLYQGGLEALKAKQTQITSDSEINGSIFTHVCAEYVKTTPYYSIHGKDQNIRIGIQVKNDLVGAVEFAHAPDKVDDDTVGTRYDVETIYERIAATRTNEWRLARGWLVANLLKELDKLGCRISRCVSKHDTLTASGIVTNEHGVCTGLFFVNLSL